MLCALFVEVQTQLVLVDLDARVALESPPAGSGTRNNAEFRCTLSEAASASLSLMPVTRHVKPLSSSALVLVCLRSSSWILLAISNVCWI